MAKFHKLVKGRLRVADYGYSEECCVCGESIIARVDEHYAGFDITTKELVEEYTADFVIGNIVYHTCPTKRDHKQCQEIFSMNPMAYTGVV